MKTKDKTASVSPENPVSDRAVQEPTRKVGKTLLVIILTLFVAAGITAITVFMTVILPPLYRRQAYETYAPVLQSAQKGDEIRIGKYEQDGNTLNGREDVEWIVLDKKDNQFLLISKYALDCVRFNSIDAYVTWDYSTLLRWLNDHFYNTVFDLAERTMILESDVNADPNPFFKTDPGGKTSDRVFILSIEEAYRYFPSEISRKCLPTEYTVGRGVHVDEENGNCCCWWLRSPGYDASVASRVMADGNISYCGYRVHSGENAVRPSVWIELDPAEVSS